MSWAAEWDIEGRALDKWLLGDREDEDAAFQKKMRAVAAMNQAALNLQMATLRKQAVSNLSGLFGGGLGDFGLK